MEAKRAQVAAAEDLAFAGDFEAAADRVREAADGDPGDGALSFLLAYYLFRAERLEEAARALGELLLADPDHGMAHHLLANCLRDLGRLEVAANHYRKALEALDDEPDAVADFGLYYLRCADLDLAGAMFRRALDLDPACELAVRGLEVAASLDRPRAPVATPPIRERRLRGPAARSAGAAPPATNGAAPPSDPPWKPIVLPTARKVPAPEALEATPPPPRPMAIQPTSITALLFAPEVDWHEVEAAARPVLAADPDDLEAGIRLAGAQVRLGDLERAELLLERLIDRSAAKPAWTGVHAEAVSLLAELHLARHDPRAARRVGYTLKRLYPSDPRTLYLLGRVDRMSGDTRQALRQFKEAALLDPDGPVGRLAAREIADMGG